MKQAVGMALVATMVAAASLSFGQATATGAPLWRLDVNASMQPWAQALVIIAGTYVLEDPTTIATGLLIRDGQVAPLVGLLAIIIGIFSGDLLLYGTGRVLGRRLLAYAPIARRLPAAQIEDLGTWLDSHGWSAVVASRFIPGTRLPLYLAAGIVGRHPARFAVWTLLAVVIWASAMILLVVFLGDAAVPVLERLFGRGLVAVIGGTLIIYLLVRLALLLATPRGRFTLAASVARLWRWEFWPAAVFYLPIVPWIALLSIRHRGVNVITSANPLIPLGGLVGESKSDILQMLPAAWTVPSARIEAGSLDVQRAALDRIVDDERLSFPLVLKPDFGERGAGVRFVKDREAAYSYLAMVAVPVIVQAYHPGPLEAGIFYYRCPDHDTGRIFSITDKVFSYVTADGRSTLEDLIWRHPRFRMQARVFLSRLGDRASHVPAAGAHVLLARAGNHCQGTMFRDGAHLRTPTLERTIDEIARAANVHFGRFDVRYADPDELRAGRGFRIVELNGITSESTNIYDPRRSLLWAYATLYRQWMLLFRIGAANQRRGHPASSHWQMVAALFDHYFRGKRVVLPAD